MVFFDSEEDLPITFWPGVYGAEGDDKTWSSLVAAIAGGAVCHGTWIARPGKLGCHPLGPWNEQFIRPKSLPASVPILVWQGCRNAKTSITTGQTRRAPLTSWWVWYFRRT